MTGPYETPDRVRLLKAAGLTTMTDFKGGGLDELALLISQMKAILSSLETDSGATWIREARRQWGQLEILYALVLEDGRNTLTRDEQDDSAAIASSLSQLFRS